MDFYIQENFTECQQVLNSILNRIRVVFIAVSQNLRGIKSEQV